VLIEFVVLVWTWHEDHGHATVFHILFLALLYLHGVSSRQAMCLSEKNLICILVSFIT
jgi:cell division protein FtsW (lipid II flippase)